MNFWELIFEKIAAEWRNFRKGNRARDFYNAGVIKAKGGDLMGAIADFNKAIELFPEYENAYANRGIALENLGKYDEAMADFEKAISISKICDVAYNGRARIKQRRQDFKGAILDYKHILLINKKKYANDFDFNMNLGVCFARIGEFHQAEKIFSEALRIKPNAPEAYIERAHVRHRLANYKGAIEDYDKAAVLNPLDPKAFTERANVKDDMGDFYGALADYKHALGLVGENSSHAFFIFFNMAVAKSRHGDIPGAIEDLKKCLKINPNDSQAEKFMARLMAKKSEDPGKFNEYR